MSDVQKNHNPNFDSVRNEAHDFASNELGLTVAPRENIAVISPAQAVPARAIHGETWGGGYNPTDNTALVVADEIPGLPLTTDIRTGAKAVHEITHSGTMNPDQHLFYNEALSGIGEQKYLEWLAKNGRYVPAIDYALQRAGVELWLPSNWRHLHGAEARSTDNAHSTQGLIAALGIAHTLPASGVKSADILRASSRHGEAQFDLMRSSLESLKSGLSKEVESLPETTDGIIQATAKIQSEARKKGYI